MIFHSWKIKAFVQDSVTLVQKESSDTILNSCNLTLDFTYK